MITEDYVTFETAKLLKEKGFDEYCRTIYNAGVFCSVASLDCRWNEGYGELIEEKQNSDFGIYDNAMSAPTLQMAMKWLREFHGLNIYARGVWRDVEVQYGDWEPVVVGYEWFVESLTDDTYSKMSKEQFLTYEEACEAAIKYCLKNLI